MKRAEAYVNCKMNADLRIANILPIKNGIKQSVKIQSPLRDLCGKITREELVKHFKMHNGKKIKMHQCKSGAFVVLGNDNRDYKALYIGNNTYKIVEAGKEESLDGVTQDQNVSYVSSEVFNRLFTVQDRRVSEKLRASYPKFFAKMDKKNGKTYEKSYSPFEDWEESKKEKQTNKKAIQDKKETNQKVVKATNKNSESNKQYLRNLISSDISSFKSSVSKKEKRTAGEKQNSLSGDKEAWKYPTNEQEPKYEAVFRIVDSYKNQTRGFVLAEIKTGKKERFHLQDLELMAKKGEISNMSLRDGKLVGVGINLDELTIMEL